MQILSINSNHDKHTPRFFNLLFFSFIFISFFPDFNGLLFVFRIKNISCLNAARLVALLTLTEVPKNVSRLSKSLSRPAVISPKFGGC